MALHLCTHPCYVLCCARCAVCVVVSRRCMRHVPRVRPLDARHLALLAHRHAAYACMGTVISKSNMPQVWISTCMQGLQYCGTKCCGLVHILLFEKHVHTRPAKLPAAPPAPRSSRPSRRPYSFRVGPSTSMRGGRSLHANAWHCECPWMHVRVKSMWKDPL